MMKIKIILIVSKGFSIIFGTIARGYIFSCYKQSHLLWDFENVVDNIINYTYGFFGLLQSKCTCNWFIGLCEKWSLVNIHTCTCSILQKDYI